MKWNKKGQILGQLLEAHNFFPKHDTETGFAPSCSSRRDESIGISFDLKRSIWFLTSGHGHSDPLCDPKVTTGVVPHIIRCAWMRRTQWCFLFPDIFILSWVINKRSCNLQYHIVTSLWRHLWSNVVTSVCNVTYYLVLVVSWAPVPLQFDYVAKMIGLSQFSEKSVGGCTSYDVIAPWHDMTWQNFFLPKDAQRLPHKLCQIWRRCAPPFFGHLRKTLGGGSHRPPPNRGEGYGATILHGRYSRFRWQVSPLVAVIGSESGRVVFDAGKTKTVRVFLRLLHTVHKSVTHRWSMYAKWMAKNQELSWWWWADHQDVSAVEIWTVSRPGIICLK